MKISIVRDGGICQIDGVAVEISDVSGIPSNVHALQWDGTAGQVEFSNGADFDSISSLPSWAVSFQANAQAVIDEQNKAAKDREDYENSDAGKAESARAKRDYLISQTDWWALSDSTMTADQSVYRQALRDITSQSGFPSTINWPVKP